MIHLIYFGLGVATALFILLFPPLLIFSSRLAWCGLEWIKYGYTREEPLPTPPWYEFDLEDEFGPMWKLGALITGGLIVSYGLGRLVMFLIHR